MDTTQKKALNRIKSLFETEILSVLSTQKNGQPYASLVAFSATPDLRELIFLTPTATRKYENLTTSPKVAMLIHNSRNTTEDIYSAVSVTATGVARTLEGNTAEALLTLFLKRHPHLKEFAEKTTTAIISVKVDTYFMVGNFQDVVEIRM